MRRATGAAFAIGAIGVIGGCTAFDAASDEAPRTEAGAEDASSQVEAGTDASAGDAPTSAGAISHLGSAVGGADMGTTVTSAAVPMDGDRYVAAISMKGLATVNGVTGLGLVWTKVAAQCSGRGLTGLEVWTAAGPALATGPVTAIFAKLVDEGSVIAVARYKGVSSLGGYKRKNTNGADGACSAGMDSGNLTMSVPTAGASGAITFGAVAIGGKGLAPDPAVTKLVEVHSPTNAAGVALLQAATPMVDAKTSTVVDWAMIGFELLP